MYVTRYLPIRQPEMPRKTGLLLLTLSIVVFITFAAMASNNVMDDRASHSSKISLMAAKEISMIAPPISLEETGSPVSLEEAEQLLGVRLLPSNLPCGTALYQVRVKGKTVTLFFKNPELQKLPLFKEDIQILLLVEERSLPKAITSETNNPITITYIEVKDNVTIKRTTTVTLSRHAKPIKRIEVNGNLGYGMESANRYPAILIWQQGNYTYTLQAYLPLKELLKIASSINSTR